MIRYDLGICIASAFANQNGVIFMGYKVVTDRGRRGTVDHPAGCRTPPIG